MSASDLVTVLAIAIPTFLTLIGAGIAAGRAIGRIESTIKDLCQDTDEIRDEIRDYRAERQMTPKQLGMKPFSADGHQ